MNQEPRVWTLQEAKADALARHSDCSYAEVYNGLSFLLRCTWVVKLWRNEECYLADDPPKYEVEGYLADTKGNKEYITVIANS